MPSAAIAGITLDDGGHPSTGIYTDDESPRIDSAQYESGRGPCLDACRQRRIVRIDDMRQAMEEYPEFARSAMEHGVGSTVSLPMVIGGEGIGETPGQPPSVTDVENVDAALVDRGGTVAGR